MKPVDMLNKLCFKCKKGKFIDSPDVIGFVHCDNCKHQIERSKGLTAPPPRVQNEAK